jgi:hypothetical protein
MTELDQNEAIVLQAKFFAQDGSTAAPQTPVQVKVLTPEGDLEGPFNMSQVETGVFEYVYSAGQVGRYRWKAETGDNAIKQGSFNVNEDHTQ